MHQRHGGKRGRENQRAFDRQLNEHSTPFHERIVDQLLDAPDLAFVEAFWRQVQKGAHHLRLRSLEKRVEQMVERRAFRLLASHCGEIDVPGTVAFVSHVPFVFQNAKQRADGRVARRTGERGTDIGDGRSALAVQHVHDLAFAAAQRGLRRLTHKSMLRNQHDAKRLAR